MPSTSCACAESAQLSTEASGEQRFEAVLVRAERSPRGIRLGPRERRSAAGRETRDRARTALGLRTTRSRACAGSKRCSGGSTELPPDLRARALLAHGGMTFMAGEFERGEQLYESALAGVPRDSARRPAPPRCSIDSRTARLQRGETDEARALTMEALEHPAPARGSTRRGSSSGHAGEHRAPRGRRRARPLGCSSKAPSWRARPDSSGGERRRSTNSARLAVEMGAFESRRGASATSSRTGGADRRAATDDLHPRRACANRRRARRARARRLALGSGRGRRAAPAGRAMGSRARRVRRADPGAARVPSLAGGREEGRRLALADAVEVALQKP